MEIGSTVLSHESQANNVFSLCSELTWITSLGSQSTGQWGTQRREWGAQLSSSPRRLSNIPEEPVSLQGPEEPVSLQGPLASSHPVHKSGCPHGLEDQEPHSGSEQDPDSLGLDWHPRCGPQHPPLLSSLWWVWPLLFMLATVTIQ